MPRAARIKEPDAMYHIMSRSISEIELFRDDFDKKRYLSILKHYMGIFKFKIYTYCLMDNHSHILIDANGADISSIFHGVNFSYAIYYNKKYRRHGHLFQGRFKSRIIGSDSYFAKLSAYIHNNPASIKGYDKRIESYEYSSLGLYMGIRDDEFDLVERGYLLTMFDKMRELGRAPKAYFDYVNCCNNSSMEEEAEFKNEKTIYASGRKILYRDCSKNKIIKFLKEKTNMTEGSLLMKNSKETVDARAIYSLFLKCFCNYRNKDIGGIIGNISQSRISMLCKKGLELIKNKIEYQELMTDFMNELR